MNDIKDMVRVTWGAAHHHVPAGQTVAQIKEHLGIVHPDIVAYQGRDRLSSDYIVNESCEFHKLEAYNDRDFRSYLRNASLFYGGNPNGFQYMDLLRVTRADLYETIKGSKLDPTGNYLRISLFISWLAINW